MESKTEKKCMWEWKNCYTIVKTKKTKQQKKKMKNRINNDEQEKIDLEHDHHNQDVVEDIV